MANVNASPAPVINVGQFSNILDAIVRLSKSGITINCMLNGHAGVGKTTICRSTAAKHDYTFVILNLHSQTPEDLAGYPYRDGDVQRHAVPDWLHRVQTSEKPALILIDEFSRGKTDVQQCMMTLLNERRINSHYIRPNDVIVCADNLDNGEYRVEPMEDRAMTSRMAQFYFEPEIAEWLKYKSVGTLKVGERRFSAIINAVNNAPFVLGQLNVVEKDKKISVLPNPRSVDLVDEIFNALPEQELKEVHIIKLVDAIVGPATSAKFYSELHDEINARSSFTVHDIYSGAWKKKLKKVDKKYVIDPNICANHLAAISADIIINNSLVDTTVDLKDLQAPIKVLDGKEEMVKNLQGFIDIIGDEQCTLFIHNIKKDWTEKQSDGSKNTGAVNARVLHLVRFLINDQKRMHRISTNVTAAKQTKE